MPSSPTLTRPSKKRHPEWSYQRPEKVRPPTSDPFCMSAVICLQCLFSQRNFKKESAGDWVPHTEFLHAFSMLSILSGKTEGRILQAPIYTPMTSRNNYFLFFIFGYWDFGTGIFKRDFKDGKICHAEAMNNQKCKHPVNRNSPHLIFDTRFVRRQW